MKTLLLLALAGTSFQSEEWGYARSDADSITLMAGALKLRGQAGWVYYNGGDAPEGAYFGRMSGATTSLRAVVTLPRQLTAGTYFLFFKGIDYDRRSTIAASLGGGDSTRVDLNDRDRN